MKTELKIGTRIEHRVHGKGIVFMKSTDPTAIIVQFDHYIEDWNTDLLEVSINQLKVDKVAEHIKSWSKI